MALAGGNPRNARLAAVAVAVYMSMPSGAAGAGDFYLRGGIGLDRPADTVFTDRDCSSSAPAALYGCGTGGDGAPYRSRGGYGTVPALELGLGYAAAAARVEILVEYRPRFAFEGRANFLAPERPAIGYGGPVIGVRDAGRLCRPGRTGATQTRPLRPVRWGRRGRGPHPGRGRRA